MSEEYTRRDYAEDKEDSVQAGSVTESVDIRAVGETHYPDERDVVGEVESHGHDSDEAAVAGYCDGSRDSREPTDKADELAAQFEAYQ